MTDTALLNDAEPISAELAASIQESFRDRNIAEDSIAIFAFEEISSTMDVSAAAAAGALTEGLLQPFQVYGRGPIEIYLASGQTAGRGRRNRRWISQPRAGIYMTILLATEKSSAELGGMSLAVGIAVQEALAGSGIKAQLKWPNDLLAAPADGGERLKLAGILIEVGAWGGSGAEKKRAVHIGIGLNLKRSRFPSDIPAISAEEAASKELSFAGLFAAVTEAVIRRSREFFEQGPAGFATLWNERSGYLGEVVDVELPGGVRKRGVVAGVAPDGALRLKEPGATGETLVHSGEIG